MVAGNKQGADYEKPGMLGVDFGFYPQGDGELHLDLRQDIDVIRFVI